MEYTEYTFRATIDRSAELRIYLISDGETLIHQKKITHSGQRGKFTISGEVFNWICEIAKHGNLRGVPTLYFYPLNINYTKNPIKVEEI